MTHALMGTFQLSFLTIGVTHSHNVLIIRFMIKINKMRRN